jgi:ABC-type transport system involved in cytochrome c biogenesis permease subunit
MLLGKITIVCFAASYGVVLGLELIQLGWPRPIYRVICAVFAGAGLLAHTLYLLVQRPSLASQFGLLLFLGWILAVYYLAGSLHHRRQARGIFVLPVLFGLTILARLTQPEIGTAPESDALPGELFWGYLHAGFLLLAAVGICVGFVASVMYLVQTHQLRAKTSHGLRLPSLENLERMNRWAINLAFPLLTGGVCIGAGLMFLGTNQVLSWSDPRIWGAIILWGIFALLLYMRYGYHLTGRRLAQLTIVAFVLLIFTLVSSHDFVRGSP